MSTKKNKEVRWEEEIEAGETFRRENSTVSSVKTIILPIIDFLLEVTFGDIDDKSEVLWGINFIVPIWVPPNSGAGEQLQIKLVTFLKPPAGANTCSHHYSQDTCDYNKTQVLQLLEDIFR